MRKRDFIVEIYIDTTGISTVFPLSILPGKVCHIHTSEDNNISITITIKILITAKVLNNSMKLRKKAALVCCAVAFICIHICLQ